MGILGLPVSKQISVFCMWIFQNQRYPHNISKFLQRLDYNWNYNFLIILYIDFCYRIIPGRFNGNHISSYIGPIPE